MSIGRYLRFSDSEPLECEVCGSTIYAGDDYQIYRHEEKKYICCDSDDCMKNLLFDLYEDDFEETHLNTKEENQEKYFEMWDDEG